MPLSGASRTKAMRPEEDVGASARAGYGAPRLAVSDEAARITAVRAPLLGLLIMVAAPLAQRCYVDDFGNRCPVPPEVMTESVVSGGKRHPARTGPSGHRRPSETRDPGDPMMNGTNLRDETQCSSVFSVGGDWGVAMVSTTVTKRAEQRGTSLEELYARHAPAAVRLAFLMTSDRELSRDIAQDAFIRVAGRFRQLRFPDMF